MNMTTRKEGGFLSFNKLCHRVIKVLINVQQADYYQCILFGHHYFLLTQIYPFFQDIHEIQASIIFRKIKVNRISGN